MAKKLSPWSCVVVNNSFSTWELVTSGIPQGSVLGLLLFVLYVSDMPGNTDSHPFLYADNTKIFRDVSQANGKPALQEDLNKLQRWSTDWQLKFI